MPCNQCGDCSYSSNSTATLSIKITSSGFEPECEPDQEILHSNLPYTSPGVWQRTLSGGQLVKAQSRCVSSVWMWAAPIAPPPGGSSCAEEPGDDTTQTDQDNCAGFHEIVTTTYSGGSWRRREVTITVNNNAECA